MRRILAFVLCLVLLGCFVGCDQPQEEKPGTKYILMNMGMGNIMMTGEQAKQESGISDLYLKLFDDGTARMRVSKEIVEMEYADGQIWRTDSPDAKVSYQIEEDTVTVVDGAYTYIFEKE